MTPKQVLTLYQDDLTDKVIKDIGCKDTDLVFLLDNIQTLPKNRIAIYVVDRRNGQFYAISMSYDDDGVNNLALAKMDRVATPIELAQLISRN